MLIFIKFSLVGKSASHCERGTTKCIYAIWSLELDTGEISPPACFLNGMDFLSAQLCTHVFRWDVIHSVPCGCIVLCHLYSWWFPWCLLPLTSSICSFVERQR